LKEVHVSQNVTFAASICAVPGAALNLWFLPARTKPQTTNAKHPKPAAINKEFQNGVESSDQKIAIVGIKAATAVARNTLEQRLQQSLFCYAV
jgi:hypothetical protein